jgi:hypothetical protein
VSITGYYQQIHFQCSDLELFYNLPVISNPDDDKTFQACPHIDKLLCSRAHELAPDKCITERECELYEYREELFQIEGIHAPTLQEIDRQLRSK